MGGRGNTVGSKIYVDPCCLVKIYLVCTRPLCHGEAVPVYPPYLVLRVVNVCRVVVPGLVEQHLLPGLPTPPALPALVARAPPSSASAHHLVASASGRHTSWLPDQDQQVFRSTDRYETNRFLINAR